jgi:hypothetical protein
MSEAFTSITFETYISGAWVNITADVLTDPNPKISGIGIMGNKITDRVGDNGTLTFSLNNSAANSAKVLGYYTPEYVNRRTGWQAGLPVRVTFVYDGYSQIKYYGTIDNDGIKVTFGKYKERRVDVKCSNWMRRAASHTLNLMDYQTSLRADQGIQNVLDNMSFKPQSVYMSQGSQSFPTVFDITKSNTSALGEINKLTFSGLDYFFVRPGAAGEEVVYMSRADWIANLTLKTVPDKNSSFSDQLLNESGGTDYILNEDGTDILLEHALTLDWLSAAYQDNMRDMQTSYGDGMANQITTRTYPRVVDAAAVVLWSLETPITIAAGETLTETRGSYTDPNSGISKVCGINMVTPVATTDYQMWTNTDGLTGVDQTANLAVTAQYGTSEVKYTLKNNGAGTYYIGKLQARGQGVYTYDPAEKTYDSATSQATYGVLPLTIDMPYLDGISSLYVLADKVDTGFYGTGLGVGVDLPELHVDRLTLDVNRSKEFMMAFMFLDISDTIRFYETMTHTDDGGSPIYYKGNHKLIGYDIDILPNKLVRWSCVFKMTGRT